MDQYVLCGFGKVDGFNGSFAVAVIGAIVVLLIYEKSKAGAELSEIIRLRQVAFIIQNNYHLSSVRPPPQLARCPSTPYIGVFLMVMLTARRNRQ